MTHQIEILILEDNKLKPESRNQLKKVFELLDFGRWQVVFKKLTRRSYTGRTKYHFGYLLNYIVRYMNENGINQIIDTATGETLPIDVDTLHQYHKQMFNPCLVKNVLKKENANGQIPEFITVPMSTTKLSDSDFIKTYEERIMAFYANEYGLTFIDRSEYNLYFEDGKDSKMIIDLQMQNV